MPRPQQQIEPYEHTISALVPPPPAPEEEIEAILDGLSKEDCDALKGRVAVITGAGGFLGRYLTPALAALCKRVIAIEPSKEGAAYLRMEISNVSSADHCGVDVREWDVLEMDGGTKDLLNKREYLRDAIGSGGLVIHAAGIASPAYYRARPITTLDLSIEGSKEMIALAHETHSRYLFFSSSEIYGNPEPGAIPTPETYPGRVSCTGARACYDEGKRVGECLAAMASRRVDEGGLFKEPLHTNVVRPFNVYGPGMQRKDYRVLPNFADCIARGVPLKIYGNGQQTRTYCHVSDAVTGFLKVLARGHPGEAYNIGNPEPEISVEHLAHMVADAASKIHLTRLCVERTSYPSNYPSDEPLRRCPDISKAREHLGYHPRVHLEDGLRRFLSWTKRAYRGEK